MVLHRLSSSHPASSETARSTQSIAVASAGIAAGFAVADKASLAWDNSGLVVGYVFVVLAVACLIAAARGWPFPLTRSNTDATRIDHAGRVGGGGSGGGGGGGGPLSGGGGGEGGESGPFGGGGGEAAALALRSSLIFERRRLDWPFQRMSWQPKWESISMTQRCDTGHVAVRAAEAAVPIVARGAKEGAPGQPVRRHPYTAEVFATGLGRKAPIEDRASRKGRVSRTCPSTVSRGVHVASVLAAETLHLTDPAAP